MVLQDEALCIPKNDDNHTLLSSLEGEGKAYVNSDF